MPWLRLSSLVRSVMSVCSSAKPGGRKVAVSGSPTHSPAGKAEARGPARSPPPTFADFLSDLRLHLLHLQQGLLPVALSAAALGAEDKQGCGHRRGGQAWKPFGKLVWAPAGRRAWRERSGLGATSSGTGVARQPRPSLPSGLTNSPPQWAKGLEKPVK